MLSSGYDEEMKIKTLNYKINLINAKEVYNVYSLQNFVFFKYLNSTTEIQQIFIGSVADERLMFYTMYAINGDITDYYEWDGFLVIFSNYNIMLFKPPLSPK